MDKKSILISVAISILVLILSIVLVLVFASGGSKKATEETNIKIQNVQADLDKIKAAKDVNNFTPTEVVKAFLNEVQAGSDKKAKLYVSAELENADLKNTLKIGENLTNISFGAALEEANGDETKVTITITGENEEEFTRSFTLSKVDEAWKIKEIIAE